MSGGSCLANTGIPIIDALFGGHHEIPVYTQREYCYDLFHHWCGPYYGPTGFSACRKVKMALFKHNAEKKGEWKQPTGQRPDDYRMWTEEAYFETLEDQLTKRGEAPYFTCNAKQREIFTEAHCQGITSYDWRYVRSETMTCKERH